MGKFIIPQVLGLFCCIVFFFVPVSCTNNPKRDSSESKVAIVDSVRSMAAAIARDLSNEGPKAWLRYFAKMPDFFMVSDGKLEFSDYKHAADFVNDTLAKTISKIELNWSDIRIDSLSPVVAVLAANFNEVLTDTAGKRMPFKGYFTGLVQRTSHGLRLRNLHWSLQKNTF